MLSACIPILLILDSVISQETLAIDRALDFVRIIQSRHEFHISLAISGCPMADFGEFLKARVSFLRDAGSTPWFYPAQREIVFTCHESEDIQTQPCGHRPCDAVRENVDRYNWRFRILILLHPLIETEPGEKLPRVSSDLDRRRSRRAKAMATTLLRRQNPTRRFSKLLLVMYVPPSNSLLIESRSLTPESLFDHGTTLDLDPEFGYPELGTATAHRLSRSSAKNFFQLPRRNGSQMLYFEPVGISLTPGGKRSLHLFNCNAKMMVSKADG